MIGSMRYYIDRDNKIHYRRVIKMAQGKSGLVYFFQDGCTKDVGIPEKYIDADYRNLVGIRWEEEDE